jgi:hypothetical protein
MSISYAAWIARKRGIAAWPAASGWWIFARRRYARRTSSVEAPRCRPSVAYGSKVIVRIVRQAGETRAGAAISR